MAYLGIHASVIKDVMKDRSFAKAHGIDFAPHQPSLFKADGRTIINSWRPPEVVPAQGEWPSIHRVLDSLLFNEVDGTQQVDTNGKAWLLNWLAWCVQNPNGVPGVAVLFNGVQGSGKNVLAQTMFRIIGKHNTEKITSDQLESRFTSSWSEKCFLLGDEMEAADYNNRDVMARLKNLITAERVSCEAKGSNMRMVDNRAKFMFASNEAMPIKLDPTDRRYTIFTRNEPVDKDSWHPFLQSLYRREKTNEPTPEFAREIAAFAWDLERMPAVRTGNPDFGGASVPYINASRASLLSASETSNVAFCKYVDANGIDGLLHAAMRKSLGYDVSEKDWPEKVPVVFPGMVDWDFGDKGVHADLVHMAYREFCNRYNIQGVVAKKQSDERVAAEEKAATARLHGAAVHRGEGVAINAAQTRRTKEESCPKRMQSSTSSPLLYWSPWCAESLSKTWSLRAPSRPQEF